MVKSTFGKHCSITPKRAEWKTVLISTVRCNQCEKDCLVGYLTRRHHTSGKMRVQYNNCQFRQHETNEPKYWQCPLPNGSTSTCGRILCDDCRHDLLANNQRGRAKPRVLPRALHRSTNELFVIPTACGCLHCVPGGLWLPTQMLS